MLLEPIKQADLGVLIKKSRRAGLAALQILVTRDVVVCLRMKKLRSGLSSLLPSAVSHWCASLYRSISGSL